jgi:hypothetical protein
VVLGSGLPTIAQKTLRFKFHDSFNPVTDLTSVPLGSWTQIASNVFDYTYNSTDWTYYDGSDSGLFNSMTKTGVNYPMGQHPFDILDGDLTGVTNVSKLFNSAKQVKRCTIRNTGSVTNFSSMFYHPQMALEYLAPLDITSAANMSLFCDSNATNRMDLVFTRDDSVPATQCDTTYMFSSTSGTYYCKNLASVTFPSTFVVGPMYRMFEFCSNLVSVSLFDTSLAGHFSYVFHGCSSLVSVPAFVTTSSITFKEAFRDCTSLVSVPTLDTGLATDLSGMFTGCRSLEHVNLFNTASATNMNSMFNGCRNVQSGALALYQQASGQATPPSSYSNCFTNCGSRAPADAPIHTEMQQIPASWGGTGA